MLRMEQRKHPRRRVLKTGRIVFNHRFSAFDCTVRNLSEGGACLVLPTTVGIPDAFDLTIEPDPTPLPCQVAWKSTNRIGVAFR
jgi:PilZ domain-containing protein